MYKRLPMEDLLQEPTNDLTRRAISLTQDMMKKDQSLSEEHAVDKVIEIFKREGLVSTRKSARSLRKREAAELEVQLEDEFSTETTKTKSGYQKTLKNISDKSIDVSKFLKDD